MTFGPLPASLVSAIQVGLLEREFQDPLYNKLAYRRIADREMFPPRIGETITKTRAGLMIPNITPLDPSTNTNLDNGLTDQNYSIEQYVLAINQYPQKPAQVNLLNDEITIVSIAMANANRLGMAQGTALDRIARNKLFNAYMGGNTVITQTLGAPATTVLVDDTRGFQTVSNGSTMVPISPSNPLPVFINGTLYSAVGFTNDVINTSSALITGGTSGIITFSSNVAVIDGTLGNPVISRYAPVINRPNGRTTTAALQSSDLLTMQVLLNSVAYLRNNGVPTVDGAYNLYLNATSLNQLYQDPDFKLLMRGATTRDPNYEQAWIYNTFLDLRFIQTTETFVQYPDLVAPVPVPVTVQRPIVCGKGALVEGIFTAGLDAIRTMMRDGIGSYMNIRNFSNDPNFLDDGIYQYLRPPIDALGQIISQTSNYVGDFTVPTDITTNPQIIPTASVANYKRAVIIETA